MTRYDLLFLIEATQKKKCGSEVIIINPDISGLMDRIINATYYTWTRRVKQVPIENILSDHHAPLYTPLKIPQLILHKWISSSRV